jgi:hypothetical protein
MTESNYVFWGVNRFVSIEIISDIFKSLSYTTIGGWEQSPLMMEGGTVSKICRDMDDCPQILYCTKTLLFFEMIHTIWKLLFFYLVLYHNNNNNNNTKTTTTI